MRCQAADMAANAAHASAGLRQRHTLTLAKIARFAALRALMEELVFPSIR
jgi:hypothetical protein